MAALVSSGSHWELEKTLAALGEKERRELFQHERLRLSLHVAYTNRSTPVLRRLLRQRCVSLEERDQHGRTVLYRAAADNKLHLVQLFLQHGADVRSVDSGLSEYDLPLTHVALRYASLEAFKALVEAGADIYSSSPLGSSALFVATYLQHESAVEYLLSRKPKKRDSRFLQDCSNTFMFALKHDVPQIVASLWPFRPASGPSRMTLFQRALFLCSDFSTAEVILERSSRSEQILQHELMGVRGAKGSNAIGAFSSWKTAMSLRWYNPRRPVLKKVPPNSVADLIGTREVQSREELAALAVTPANVYMQALLITERIMPASKELLYFLLKVVRGTQDGKKVRALLCRAASAVSDCSVEREETYEFERRIFEIHSCARNLSYSHFSFSDMLSLLETLVYMISRRKFHHQRDYEEQREVDVYMLHSLRQLLLLQATASVPEQQRLNEMLTSYILARKPFRALSMFSAITATSYDVHTVETLVHVSAHVSGICSRKKDPIHLIPDEHGETPLHHLVWILNKSQLRGEKGVISLFLRHGADLCSQDNRGRRISDLLEGRGILNYRPPSLKCLAARVVHQQEGGTVVGRQDISQAVQNFIMEH